MTIKKSVLEQKWYYRITKVFLLSLPMLAALIVIAQGEVKTGDAIASLLIFTAVGWVIWSIMLNAVWRLLLYIIYGGLEDDLKKKKLEPVAVFAPVSPQQNQSAAIIVTIFIFVFLTVLVMAFATSR
jgi:hypothetical protein